MSEERDGAALRAAGELARSPPRGYSAPSCMPPTSSDRPAAVLVAVQLPGVSDQDHAADLAELRRLVHTLGHEVIGTVTQRRSALAAAAVLGEGKLLELGRWTGGTGVVPSAAPAKKDKARARRSADADTDTDMDTEADAGADADADSGTGTEPTRKAALVVVDHEVTPSQARNLERATGAEVLDRSGVIVEIFHRHAHSRQAKLEVEIARLNYVAPRLREGGGGDRQRGGIGGKGAGESALELDRRRIRDRIAELREEIAAIQKEQGVRRAHRSGARRVALVGYTNAGKSSLMRALTGSEVLVADKLFATLDTTVRALHPEAKPRILVSDTVGFIKKLPHDLVASFRSTLDEALEASLLLYVADASDPTFRGQLEVTRSTLAEIGADAVPSRLLLNKVDRLDEAERAVLAAEFPDAIRLSAKAPADVAALRQTIVEFFEASMVEGEILVPYDKQNLVGQVYEAARVLGEAYDEAGRRLTVRAEPAALARLQGLLARGS
jgi:GTP-binding protein HflX